LNPIDDSVNDKQKLTRSTALALSVGIELIMYGETLIPTCFDLGAGVVNPDDDDVVDDMMRK
jgi:hypothetical protein